MRLIVAGSRDFSDYELLCEVLDEFLGGLNIEAVEIVSGGARGADRLGERYARERLKVPAKLFLADWRSEGRSAGITRNIRMGQYGDALVAFWDGESRGTGHMISLMKSLKKPCKVVTRGSWL